MHRHLLIVGVLLILAGIGGCFAGSRVAPSNGEFGAITDFNDVPGILGSLSAVGFAAVVVSRNLPENLTRRNRAIVWAILSLLTLNILAVTVADLYDPRGLEFGPDTKTNKIVGPLELWGRSTASMMLMLWICSIVFGAILWWDKRERRATS